MAAAQFIVSQTLQDWLRDGQQCLDLWLECGVSTPSPQAQRQLQNWAQHSETAGWTEVNDLAHKLLNAAHNERQKADALLDLLVWLECAMRLVEANRLEMEQ